MSALAPLRYQNARESAVRRELHAGLERHLRDNGEHRFGNGWLHAKAAVLALGSVLCYVIALRSHTALPFTLWFGASLFCAMLMAMNWLHDAAHNALFRAPRWNRVALRIAALAVGIDTHYWTIRHVQFHHAYANIDGYDLDIEPNPFLRQTPFQRWAPQYRYQHLYWPLVAALSLPYLVWYSDWADCFGATPVTARARQGRAAFLGWKLAHVLLVLALPIWALQGSAIGWPAVLLAYFLGHMVASCFLVATILGTHWAEVEFFRA